LIYQRFLSSQMMPAQFDTLTIEIGGERVGFRFYGERKRFPGFTTVYEESSDEEEQSTETILPQLNVGDDVALVDVKSEQHFTQPPPRYTEASLVRTLEEKGIGRPSTYAPTISTILARGYVQRDRTRLLPTELGRMITNMMCEYFQNIVDVAFTSEMEERLDRVEEESLPWREVIRDFYGPFNETLKIAESSIEKVEISDEISDVPCDKCGSMMVYKMGRYGKFLACPNFPECRNTKPITNYIDVTCPKCDGRLVERSSRKGSNYYSCERRPDCDFISWDRPVTEKCPRCGSYMVFKQNRKGEQWHLCANETCRHKVPLELEIDDA